jgi:UDP-2-acetamido-3-amino-2,3-dideoxy-glucuronate N-acetyltransferase
VFTHIAFPRAAVNRRDAFEKTIVKSGVSLGANATVVPGITIGTGTFLAAGSTLTKDSLEWAMMMGTPARQVAWVSAYGERIPLPLDGQGRWRCDHTGDEYMLAGQTLIRHPGPIDILAYVPGQKLQRIVGD